MSITTTGHTGGAISQLSPTVLARLTREAENVWRDLRSLARLPDMESSHGRGVYVNASIQETIRRVTGRRSPQDVKSLLHFMLSGEVVTISADKVFVPSVFEVHMPEESVTSPRRAPDGIDWRADHLTPTEAGEDRKPEPVIVRAPKKCKETPMAEPLESFDLSDMEHVIFNEDTVRALRYLGANGVIENKSGLATGILAKEAGVTDIRPNSVMTTLRDHGLIETDTRSKKTYRIAITRKGRYVLTQIDRFRITEELIIEWLRRQGGAYANPENPKKTTSLIARSLPAPTTSEAVARAMFLAEDRGRIKRERTKGGNTIRVELAGAEKVKGFTPTDEALDSGVFEATGSPVRASEPVPVTQSPDSLAGARRALLEAAAAYAAAIAPPTDPVTIEMCERLSVGHEKALAALRKIADDPRSVYDHVDTAIAALEESAL